MSHLLISDTCGQFSPFQSKSDKKEKVSSGDGFTSVPQALIGWWNIQSGGLATCITGAGLAILIGYKFQDTSVLDPDSEHLHHSLRKTFPFGLLPRIRLRIS